MVAPLIIDSHLHLFRKREYGVLDKINYEVWEYGDKQGVIFSSYAGDLADTLQAMDQAGAQQAVVVNLFSPSLVLPQAIMDFPLDISDEQKTLSIKEINASMPQRLKESNEWTCQVARDHPQLVPFIALDPSILTISEMESHIREMADHGARGVKMHPALQKVYMHDERMLQVWKTALELGFSIIAHSGPSKGDSQYAEPDAFSQVLAALPGLPVVLAHMGGGGSWRQCLDIAQAFPDAYFDLCEIIEWCGAPHAPTTQELARLILDVGYERVLFGSDFPWYDIEHTKELVLELPILAKEQKEAILGANAIRILGI
jgi:predicted TIM-barrel fold metal-dependent hydrolase